MWTKLIQERIMTSQLIKYISVDTIFYPLVVEPRYTGLMALKESILLSVDLNQIQKPDTHPFTTR